MSRWVSGTTSTELVYKREELRSCPKCGSYNFTYLEVIDNFDGTELLDMLECNECGCRYHLVFEFARKEER